MATPIDQFAALTRSVIAEEGFDDYLPTAMYPSSQRVKALQGVPRDADLERIAVDWAARNAIDGEEFLVAFKISADQFKIIHRRGEVTEARVFGIEEVD